MKTIPLFACVLGLAAVLGLGCKTAKVTSEVAYSPPPTGKPTAVHVVDFGLGLDAIQHQDGLLSALPGAAGRAGDRLSGASSSPSARARQIVDLMSDSLVKELDRRGFSAGRLQPGVSLPKGGWLVRGAFLEVQEGNRLRRSLIGFGEGQTDLQVVTTIDDLAQGVPKPLYQVATDAASGSTPGAAPTLAMGPYGAAARFVMAGNDLERNVKQTAAQIAEQMAQHIQTAK